MIDHSQPPAASSLLGYAPNAADRLTAHDVFRIFWQGRFWIIAITMTITAVVAVTAYILPPRFQASVLMMPVTDMEAPDRNSSGSSSSALGGLASLAGLTAGGSSLKTEALATLESEALTDRFIHDNDLLPILYRDQWDPILKRWKVSDPKKQPDLWRANRLFHEYRDVVDNPRTGLITLTITWRDPIQAAKWANELVRMTNEYIRDRTIDEAERNTAFLEKQASGTHFVAMQEAISNLTEAQLKKIMLARGREQYALKVLDPATVPERKSFPRPTLWTVAAFFGGLFLSMVFVLLRAPDGASKPATSQTGIK